MSNTRRTPTPTNAQKDEFIRRINAGIVHEVQEMLRSNRHLANISDPRGDTALILAIREGTERVIELIMEYGADPNKASRSDGTTPLMTAASNSRTRIMRLLFQNGANNVNAINRQKWTALMFAVSNNRNSDIVKLLIENGASVNMQNDHQETALLIATQFRKKSIVKLLVEAGADPNIADFRDETPLITAREMGDRKMVELLTGEYEFDPNNLRNDPELLQDFYEKTDKFSDQFYNSTIREKLRPMDPKKMCKEDIDTVSFEEITSTSSSKPNRLLVWVRVPRNPKASSDKIIYDCFTLDTYLDILKRGNKNPTTRAHIAKDSVRFYYIESNASSSSSTRFGKGKSNGKSKGKSNGKSKKPQKRPSSAVCTRAQKLGVRLTLKRNNKRVYKSEEMLRKQIKNAVNKRKQKQKQSKRK